MTAWTYVPLIGISGHEGLCLLLLSLVVSVYIARHFQIGRQQTVLAAEPEDLIRKEHNRLVKEERLLEAKALFLKNYRCFDDNPMREFEVRVGEAQLDVANKDNLDALFELSKDLCSSKETILLQKERIQKKTHSILIARTRFLLRSYKKETKETSIHRAARYESFLELWDVWLDFLELYTNRKETVFQKHFRILYALNRVLCRQELLADWKKVVGSNYVQETQIGSLQRCKALVASQKWEESFLQYNIFFALSSDNLKGSHEYCLFVQILVQIAIKNIKDRKVVMDTFAFAKGVVANKHVSKSGKAKCISMLFALLEARVKCILPSIQSLDIQFLHKGIDHMDAPFLVRLEVFHLWQEFLKVCQESHQFSSSVSSLMAELSRREKDALGEKSLAAKIAPYRSDPVPIRVQ